MKHSFALFYLLAVGMPSSAGAVEVAVRADVALNAVDERMFAMPRATVCARTTLTGTLPRAMSKSPVDFFGTEGVPLVHELEIGETERWQTLYAGVPDPATPGAFRSFKGNTWFKVPSEALDVPPGTPCRMTIEASLDLPEGMVARFKLRTDKSVIYAHQGYLYTPQGKSSRRYVVEFPRPEPTEEPFNLFLQRGSAWQDPV